MHTNHEFVKMVILSREVSIVDYQRHYEEKGAQVEVAFNAIIMLKLVKSKMDIHKAKNA